MSPKKIHCLATAATIVALLLIAGCANPTRQTTTPEPKETVQDTPPPAETTKAEPKEIVKPEPKEVVKVEPTETVKTTVEPNQPRPEPNEPKPTVKMALRFAPQDTATYNVTTEADKSVLWQGPAGSTPTGFKGGHTANKSQLTFTQRVKSVDDKGNATAEITIKHLKYLATVKDSIVLDFDSSRENDQKSPLYALIGQSYTITLTPSGGVPTVVDVTQAQAAVKGTTTAHKTAASLISTEMIKQRHEIPAMPAPEKSQIPKGAAWSTNEVFDFGMMGKKSYEKIYTLEQLEDADGRQVAVARMTALPSSEKAQEMHQQQTSGFLSKMFDNTETFTGELKLDLAAGRLEKFREELKSEWLAVDPAAGQDDQQPAALKMAALRLHNIERID